jgi:pyocin large subunit-like protein
MARENLEWALEQQTDSPADKVVLMVLADAADGNGEACPSVARIAHCSRASEHTVRRSLRTLADQGFILEMDGGGLATARTWKVGK